MKIEADQEGVLILREVFNSVIFEAEGGERLVVCMRDNAFDIAVLDKSVKNPSGYMNAWNKRYQWFTASSRGIMPHHPMEKREAGNDSSD